MTPRFSVVIPAFNAARTIEATIRSVYLQTTGDFEIAVVDDGSSDDTVELARRLADERVTVLRQDHDGPAAARNLAISHTRGRFVCPLDADDLLLPHFLERMGEALEMHEHAGFAYTDAWMLDDTTQRVRRASAKAYQHPPRNPPDDPTEFVRLLLDRNFVYGCTLIRRSVLETVGGYVDGVSGSEDYELWLRIAAHGYVGARVDGRLAVYRVGQSVSNSSDPLKMNRAQQGVYRLVAERHPVDDATRALALARLETFRRLESRMIDRPAAGWRDRAWASLKGARRRALKPWRWQAAPDDVRLLIDETRAVRSGS